MAGVWRETKRALFSIEWQSGLNRFGYLFFGGGVILQRLGRITLGYGISNNRATQRDWVMIKMVLDFSNRKSQMGVIFVTVFVDLLGFGMIIPLLPYLATEYHATPLQVGLLMSIYSLMQFIFAPFWGRLSDRYGRRPILLVSLFGAALAHLGFAMGSQLWILFAARLFAGAFGGNISTAMAYIADITDEKDRSKGMGLIGAAFGLGFVFGPFVGGVTGDWGMMLGSEPPFGMNFSALVASAICFANFLSAVFILSETLPVERRGKIDVRPSRIKLLFSYLTRPIAGPLMFTFFVMGLAMSHMEATLFLYVKDQFGWNLRTASFGFAYVGVMMVFTQGYLVRKLLPRFGERRLLPIGLSLFLLGMYGIGFSHSVAVLAVVMTVLALGNGLSHPSILGTISLVTPKEEQGSIMGVTQSLAALGRILGPAMGGFFYGEMGREYPYLIAGTLGLLGFLVVGWLFPKIPEFAKNQNSAPH